MNPPEHRFPGTQDARPAPSDGQRFATLIERAKGGDERARSELCSRYSLGLLARIRRRLPRSLRRRYDSVDVVQSVTAELLRHLETFEQRGEDAFRHWLYTAAENKIRGKLRKSRDRDGRPRERALPAQARERMRAAGPGPATDAEHTGEGERALDRLGALDPDLREVVRLRLSGGLTFREIAERVGAPSANAARMRYHRALAALRAKWMH